MTISKHVLEACIPDVFRVCSRLVASSGICCELVLSSVMNYYSGLTPEVR